MFCGRQGIDYIIYNGDYIMGYLGNQITTVFPTSISVDSATISGNASVGGTLGVTGVSTLSDNIVFDASSKGVHLGVTSATASNFLDDYEEGTWTATAADADGNTGSATSNARYVKIGSLVYVSFVMNNINTTGMASSSKFEIRGLPFTCNEFNYGLGSVMHSNINLSTATNVTLTAGAEVNQTRIRFFESSDNGAITEITSNYITDDTSDIHAVSICYFTNS